MHPEAQADHSQETAANTAKMAVLMAEIRDNTQNRIQL